MGIRALTRRCSLHVGCADWNHRPLRTGSPARTEGNVFAIPFAPPVTAVWWGEVARRVMGPVFLGAACGAGRRG